MRRLWYWLLFALFLGSSACNVLSPPAKSTPTISRDTFATGLAEAIAATMTAEIPTESPKRLSSVTPDHIATNVAEAQAIAATLTASARLPAPPAPTEVRPPGPSEALAPTAAPLPTAAPKPPAVPEPTKAPEAALEVVPAPTQAPPAVEIYPPEVTEVVIPIPTAQSLTGKAGIFFTVGNDLYRMDLDGSNPRVVTHAIGQSGYLSEFMAVDKAHNKLYLSNSDDMKIYALDLKNPRSLEVVCNNPGVVAQGLDIDPTGSMMVLGLYYAGVYVMDMNHPGYWTQLVYQDVLSSLHGERGQLQLDPYNGQIYFRTAYNSGCELCRYIWRVNLDASNLIKIIPYSGGDGLALDLTQGKMYFSDVYEPTSNSGSNTIYRANLDGSGIETILDIPGPYTYGRMIYLDPSQQKMYLYLINTDNGYLSRAIARANMDGSGFEYLYETTRGSETEASGGMVLYLP